VKVINEHTIGEVVAAEMSRIADQRLAEEIRTLLVAPRCEIRKWDYSGQPWNAGKGEYPCWIVARRDEYIVFAYCERGFGPKCPWGILSADPSGSMGPDNCWYESLEAAVNDA
jgi:hypothetical protein